MKPPAKVLIVDHSAILRKALSEIVESQPGLQVLGTAPDPIIAQDKILALKPDVRTRAAENLASYARRDLVLHTFPKGRTV